MNPKLKTALAAIGLIFIAYFILFRTNLIISQSRTFNDWVRDYELRGTGKQEDRPLLHMEYPEEIRRDFLQHCIKGRTKILEDAEASVRQRTKSDKIAWISGKEGNDLYLTNLGPFLKESDDFEPTQWQMRVNHYLRGTSESRVGEKTRTAGFLITAFIAEKFDAINFVNQYSETSNKGDHVIDLKALRSQANKFIREGIVSRAAK